MMSVSSLARFSDPEGICSVAKATAAGVVLPPSALSHAVVSKGGKLSVSSMRLMYGHEVADATAHLHPAEKRSTFTYAPLSANRTNLVDSGGDMTKGWNPADPSSMSNMERLSFLRSDPDHGFILAVVKHWDTSINAFGAPILRIVAAPSMISTPILTDTAIDPEAIWSTLPSFIAASQAEVAPIIVAGAGFTRDASVAPSVSSLFLASDPLVLLSAEEVAGQTTVAGSDFWRTWFLPLGCCAPVGLTWDLHSTSVPELIATVKGINSKSGERFGATLTPILPELTTWLAAAQDDPDAFAIEAVPWLAFAAYFPNLQTGAVPMSIDDEELLAPMLDAVSLFTWRLVVDKMLTSTVVRPLMTFYTYLDFLSMAIPDMECFGGRPEPKLLPQVPYLFPIHGGWPFGADWSTLLQAPHLVSSTTALWAPSTIDLQTEGFTPSVLSTRADQDASDHRARTPTMALGSGWRPRSVHNHANIAIEMTDPSNDPTPLGRKYPMARDEPSDIAYQLDQLQERHEAEVAILRQHIAESALQPSARPTPHQLRLSVPGTRRTTSPVVQHAIDIREPGILQLDES